MKSCSIRVSLLALCGMVLLAGPALAQVGIGKYQYHVRGDVLMRGKYNESIKALRTPQLMDPATTWADLVKTLNHLSEVGSNAICIDLVGVNADGTAISPEALKQLDLVMEQSIWRRMQALCKVFPDGAPTDAAYREKLVETAAKALAGRSDCVFWIDGPDAAALAKKFKEISPALVVAAPENGDVLAVTETPQAKPATPVLLVGKIPFPVAKDSNFVLPGTEENYQKFETAMSLPEDLEPWTPDNSVLSEEERKEGFISLFDGKSLDGWAITGDNKNGFVVRDGAIEWNAGGGSQLRTVKRYDNYVLRLEWRIGPNKNNGLQLRTPRANRNSKVGFEFQMLGKREDPPTNESTASLYDVQPPLVDASKPAMEWNVLEITLDGPHYKAVLNGVLVQDVNFDENDELRYRLRNGFIAISDHGGYAAFRNIRLKPL